MICIKVVIPTKVTHININNIYNVFFKDKPKEVRRSAKEEKEQQMDKFNYFTLPTCKMIIAMETTIQTQSYSNIADCSTQSTPTTIAG